LRQILFSLLALSTLILGAACSQNHFSSPPQNISGQGIVGGESATAADLQSSLFAATVEVSWSDDSSGRDIECTGSLIAADLVLTAAHCLTEIPATATVQIDFLTLNASESLGLPKMLTKKFVLNEAYVKDENRHSEDLALILLPQPAPAGTRIAPLASAKQNSFWFSGLALGYGKSDDTPAMRFSENNGSGRLRSVNLQGLMKMDNDGSGVSGMIAAQQSHGGICQGDSGGPLYVAEPLGQMALAGVTEMVTPSEDGGHLCGGFSYFVSVVDHLDWIATQTANLRKESP
jgi:secreted trypsin-like serine protease